MHLYPRDFSGYFACRELDSLAFLFDQRTRGYLQSSNGKIEDLDKYGFSNERYPFGKTGFERNGNEYTFIVTQSDYENAHELPN